MPLPGIYPHWTLPVLTGAGVTQLVEGPTLELEGEQQVSLDTSDVAVTLAVAHAIALDNTQVVVVLPGDIEVSVDEGITIVVDQCQ